MGIESIEQLKKRPLYSHEIKDLIKQSILSGELKPGDRVVETRLARKLGVSQSPVREAIRELEIVGLIESRPYQGAFVRVVDKQGIIDAYKVRSALEIVAMQTIVNTITPAQLDELSILMQKMERAGKDKEFELFIELDSLFHERIVEMANNELLLHLWNQCKIRDYTRISTCISTLSMDELAQRHNMMYDALNNHDESLVATAITEHFELLSEQMRDLVPSAP